MYGHDESVSRIDGPAEGEGQKKAVGGTGEGEGEKAENKPNGRSCQLLRERVTAVVRVALFMYVKSLVTKKYCPIVKQILVRINY